MSWRFSPLAITKRRGILDNGEQAYVARFLSPTQAKTERRMERNREILERLRAERDAG